MDLQYNIDLKTTLTLQEKITGEEILTKLLSANLDTYSFVFQGRVFLNGFATPPATANFTIPQFVSGSGPALKPFYKLIYVKNVGPTKALPILVRRTDGTGTFDIPLDSGDFILWLSQTTFVNKQIIKIDLVPSGAIDNFDSVEYFVAG